jgi:hypothetical protein
LRWALESFAGSFGPLKIQSGIAALTSGERASSFAASPAATFGS